MELIEGRAYNFFSSQYHAHWRFMIRCQLFNLIDFFAVFTHLFENEIHTGDSHDFCANSVVLSIFTLSYLLIFVIGFFNHCLQAIIENLLVLFFCLFIAVLYNFNKHICNFFKQEWHWPLEKIEVAWQMEWLFRILVLFNVHFFFLY